MPDAAGFNEILEHPADSKRRFFVSGVQSCRQGRMPPASKGIAIYDWYQPGPRRVIY